MKSKENIIKTLFILCFLFIFPFNINANAYGNINNEKVVDVGQNHFVVLKEDGSVWMWGEQKYGQLGSTSILDSDAIVENPIPVQK